MKRIKWLSIAVLVLFSGCADSGTGLKSATSVTSLNDSSWEKCWEEAGVKVEIIDEKLKISTKNIDYSLNESGKKATFKNGAEIVLDENGIVSINGTFQTKLAIQASIIEIKKDVKITYLTVKCSCFENFGNLKVEELRVFKEESRTKDRQGFFNLGTLYCRNFNCDQMEILNKKKIQLENELNVQSITNEGSIVCEHGVRITAPHVNTNNNGRVFFKKDGVLTAQDFIISDHGAVNFSGKGMLTAKSANINGGNVSFTKDGMLTIQDLRISRNGSVNFSGEGMLTAKSVDVADKGKIIFKEKGKVVVTDIFLSKDGKMIFEKERDVNAKIHRK